MSKEKNDYAFYSEALHSSYLFYTMEVDRLNKQLQACKEENERQHELRLKSERDWDKREKQWISEAEKAWTSQSSEYAKELEHTIRLRDEQIQTLTRQNKQMREALDDISTMFIFCKYEEIMGKKPNEDIDGFPCQEDMCKECKATYCPMRKAQQSLKGGE